MLNTKLLLLLRKDTWIIRFYCGTAADRLFFWQVKDVFELNFRLDVWIKIPEKERQKSQIKDSKPSHNRRTIWKKKLIALEKNKPTSQHLCDIPEEILATPLQCKAAKDQVSINLVQQIKPSCLVPFEMPQGTFRAAMGHGFQRDQCPVGQNLKRPSKVFLGTSELRHL